MFLGRVNRPLCTSETWSVKGVSKHVGAVAVYLTVIFLAGLVAVLVRLPPLIGFLAAGFILNGLDVEPLPGLHTAADLGVTLLLFGIGLKLDVRSLLSREVWQTAGVHGILSISIGMLGMWVLGLFGAPLLAGQDVRTLTLIGFALSFSSTVLVVKILDEHAEAQSYYGRIAIGILILQDVAAVVFITASSGHWPSPWAVLLVFLPALIWVLRKVWDVLPHGEMQAVFGVAMALVPGYALFEALGLKGDLGALIVGVLMAGHPAAGELSRLLMGLKELLLVAFFVSIGITGVVTGEALLVGTLLMLLLPAQSVGYIWLLHMNRLRRRTSVFAGLALSNYSEFALIVTAVGVEAGMLPETWLIAITVAVALSMVVAPLVGRRRDTVLAIARRVLPRWPEDKVHVHERPIDLDGATAVVLGMGRIGRSAYEELRDQFGYGVVGVESSAERVESLSANGYLVEEADATDPDFWDRLKMSEHVNIAVLAMPFHGTNLEALRRLHQSGFDGVVAAVAQYDDQVREIREQGADVVIQLYDGVGLALAESAVDMARPRHD